MLATVIKVAGAFELLRGGTDVLSGIQKGIRASRVAGIGLQAAGGHHAASAAGGAILPAVLKKSGKGAGILGRGIGSLVAGGASRALALGVGGKTLGGGIAAALSGSGLATGAGAAGSAAAFAGGTAMAFAAPIALGVGGVLALQAGPDLWRAYQSGRKLDKFRARSEERLGVAGQLRGGAAQALGASVSGLGSALDSSSRRDDQLNSFGKMQAIQQRLKTIGQARARIQLDIMKSQEGGRRNIELETTARQAQKELSERVLRDARKLQGVYKSQNAERQKAIDKRKEELEASKRLFEQEKNRVKDIATFLGGKTRGELASLRSAARSVGGGSFRSTAKNLSDLESLGGPLTEQFVQSQRFARGFQAFGASPSLSVFTGGQDIFGPNSQLSKMRGNINDEQERIQVLTQELSNSTNAQNNLIIKMMERYIGDVDKFTGQLQRLAAHTFNEALNRR